MSARTQPKINRDFEPGTGSNADLDDSAAADTAEPKPDIEPKPDVAEKNAERNKILDELGSTWDEAKKRGDEALAGFKKLAAGEIGADGNVKLKPDETKAATELERKAETAIDKNHILKLEGDADDRLDALTELWDKLLDSDKKSTTECDFKLYRSLVDRGSKQDEKTGNYSGASAEEQARLRQMEGPFITREVLARMSNGEISWTTNGAFKAIADLREGRDPATGKRFKKISPEQGADVIDINTGKKIVKGVALAAGAAALAAGAAALAGSKEWFEDEAGLGRLAAEGKTKTEQGRSYTEIVDDEREARMNETLGEEARLVAERKTLDQEAALIVPLIRVKERGEREAALIKNMELIARYLKRYDTLLAKTKESRFLLEDMNDRDYITQILEPRFNNSDAIRRRTYMDEMFVDALRMIYAKRKTNERRLLETRAVRAQLEREKSGAAFDTDDKSLEALRLRLIEVNAEINRVSDELAGERDKESKNFRELYADLNALRAERMELENAIAPHLTEKARSEAKLKKIRGQMAELRKKIDSGNDDARYVETMTEIAGLAEDEAKENERLAALIAVPGAYYKPTAVPVGIFEPVAPVKPNARIAADIEKTRTVPKTGFEIFRTTKADGKIPPPNPETETIIKETYRHAREIFAARKNTYREDIASGELNAAELKEKKEKLSALTPLEAVKNVLAASENEMFVIKGKNFNLLAPFVEDMFRQIMADTDELITLAEKTPAPATAVAVEPKPILKSPEREAAEKIVESAKTKFAARIEEVAGENPATVENLYRRLVNAKPENMAKELTDILINGDCLTEDERAKLSAVDLKTLRKEAINICFEKISKKPAVKKSSAKTDGSASPAPAATTEAQSNAGTETATAAAPEPPKKPPNTPEPPKPPEKGENLGIATRFLNERAVNLETRLDSLDQKNLIDVREALEGVSITAFRKYLTEARLDNMVVEGLSEPELNGLLSIEKVHLDNLIALKNPKKKPASIGNFGELVKANGDRKKNKKK